MKDKNKTKVELIAELEGLRKKVSEMESACPSGLKGSMPSEADRFYFLLDCLPFFAYLQAPDHSIRYANSSFRELYGEPGDRPCYEVMWSRSEPCDECPTFRVFDTGKPEIWEAVHPDDGRTYKVYDYPFTDADGTPLVLEISVDLTGVRRAEEASADRRSFLQTLMDTIPSPIFYKDSSGRYLGCNSAFEEAIGFADSGLSGRKVFDAAPKERAAKYHEMDSALFKTPGTQVYESRVRFKDGTMHDVIFNKATLLKNGKVTGLVGVITDITDRKAAEDALAESEGRLRTISDNSVDYLMVTDTAGVLRYMNRTIPGLPGEQEVGRPITDWLPAASERAVMDCLGRVTKSGEPETFSTELVTVDGAIKSFEARVGPVFRGSSVEELTIVATDVTERKKAEKEREQLSAQLLQSQKMEAIGTLAGGIAHDFNNIITVVKTLTDLMLSKVEGDDPLCKYLMPISESAGRAINLVQQLLIFSRNRPVEFERLDLSATVSGLMGMLSHLISEDILIETEFSYDAPKVRADTGRLDQLITNLVINASDAMPQGGLIHISTEQVSLDKLGARAIPGGRPGEYVRLGVRDTGAGIAPEVLPHIFEPFYTTKSTAGTGMGLAVVYGIAREHGGWVNVQSEAGEGTTFTVYLPVAGDEDGETAAALEHTMPGYGEGKRILLVEDEKWVRRSTAMVLSEYGYEVYEAANAENALAIFYREKGRFDLVMSDVVMPGRDGLQLVSPLMDINPAIPILLCSGHLDDKAQISQIVKRGLAYIHKPFEIPELLQAIEETITENPGRV